jgi:hypothetical protein
MPSEVLISVNAVENGGRPVHFSFADSNGTAHMKAVKLPPYTMHITNILKAWRFMKQLLNLFTFLILFAYERVVFKDSRGEKSQKEIKID